MKTLILSFVFAFSTQALALNVGDTAPSVSLVHLGTGAEATSDVRSSAVAGQKVVIEYFLTQCPACIANLPNYKALAAEYAGKVSFKLVGVDRNEAAIRTWADEQSALSFSAVVLDSKRVSLKPYGVTGTPTTFVLDENGKVLFIHEDVWSDGDIATIQALLK